MQIEFEGRTWEFDPDDLDVKQATVLYVTYQMTIMQYSQGFDVLDQRAYHFAYWLMLQQNGVVKPIADCNPKIIGFIAAVTEARVADRAAEVAEAAEAETRLAAETDPTSEPPGGPQGEPTASTASATQKATNRQRRDQPEAPTGSEDDASRSLTCGRTYFFELHRLCHLDDQRIRRTESDRFREPDRQHRRTAQARGSARVGLRAMWRRWTPDGQQHARPQGHRPAVGR